MNWLVPPLNRAFDGPYGAGSATSAAAEAAPALAPRPTLPPAEAPYLASRSWWVGLHRCTVSVPRAEPGRAAIATVRWVPKAPAAIHPHDLRDFRAGCHALIENVEARWGVRVSLTSPFFTETGEP